MANEGKSGAKVQLLDQVGVIEKLAADSKAEPEFIFRPMSDEEKDKDGIKSSFPNDDAEFSSLRHLSYVEDESPKFEKFTWLNILI